MYIGWSKEAQAKFLIEKLYSELEGVIIVVGHVCGESVGRKTARTGERQ